MADMANTFSKDWRQAQKSFLTLHLLRPYELAAEDDIA